MNLYTSNDVLGDWTMGMMVVAAPDVDSIRDVILAHTDTNASGGTYLVFDPDADTHAVALELLDAQLAITAVRTARRDGSGPLRHSRTARQTEVAAGSPSRPAPLHVNLAR